MMSIKEPQTKASQPTSFMNAKLIDAAESEIVIEYQGGRIELPAINGNWNRDKIGKVGAAKYAGEGGAWAFVVE
jgi:hypothetical protein